ncbi:MAG: hypothetical protein PW845_15955 [Pseudomonas sp.]|uniref:hypothetical protein n=1 Tax=Pseudomonas abieticivorans TaxID=2931382 RepID=UPI0020BF60EE|nr:hypothetical protein [Pseudomonas sp. PIA16]MDE1166832.1 hypothetical protein [Pseudomonas sp.]
MANVTVDADIKAKWDQAQGSYSPGNPEELAIIAIDLLVKDIGNDAALSFITQVFEKYSADHGHAAHHAKAPHAAEPPPFPA